MTALRVRGWGVIRSELCLAHLLEEHREVGADTRLPRGRESSPDLVGLQDRAPRIAQLEK